MSAETASSVGVALAGGASRRMGRDKAGLELGGGTLLQWTVKRLRAVCREVIVADRGRRGVLGCLSVEDGPGAGPVAGILGAALARPGQTLLVLACDLPNLPIDLLRDLLEAPGAEWVVPRHGPGPGRLEPLCARYSPSAVEALASRVGAGSFSLHELAGIPGLRVHYLEEKLLRSYGDPDHLFLNLNTPGDYERYRSARESRGLAARKGEP